MKKKIPLFVLILLAVLFFNIDVKAESLDDYGIICQYGDMYVKYYSPNANTVFKIETNFDYYLAINVEEGRPKKILSDEAEMNWLKSVGLVREIKGREMFTCPNDKPFGSHLNNKDLKITYGRFSGVITRFPHIISINAIYDSNLNYNGVYCEYGVSLMDGTGNVVTDSNGNEKVFYSFSYTGNGLSDVYKFGDGYEEIKKLGIDLESGRPKKSLKDTDEFNWLIDSDIIISTGNEAYKKFWSCPSTLDDINDLDNDGYNQYTLIKQRCKTTVGEEGGFCNIANIRDSVVEDQPGSSQEQLEIFENGECPKALKTITFFIKKIIINIIQIFIPIVLILMGTIDLAKAVMTSDDKAMKDAVNRLIKRVIYAIAIFFVVTIVTVVMDLFAKVPDIGAQNTWKSCWFDNE